MLVERGLTVAVAESCTGGLMAGAADRPGRVRRRYLLGGLVVYSNEAKTELAGVPAELIEAHGAVSAEVARRPRRRRARAPRRRRSGSGSPASPGPTAGTLEKPVGLVCIALVGPPTGCGSCAAPISAGAAPTCASARRPRRCTCCAGCCSARSPDAAVRRGGASGEVRDALAGWARSAVGRGAELGGSTARRCTSRCASSASSRRPPSIGSARSLRGERGARGGRRRTARRGAGVAAAAAPARARGRGRRSRRHAARAARRARRRARGGSSAGSTAVGGALPPARHGRAHAGRQPARPRAAADAAAALRTRRRDALPLHARAAGRALRGARVGRRLRTPLEMTRAGWPHGISFAALIHEFRPRRHVPSPLPNTSSTEQERQER